MKGNAGQAEMGKHHTQTHTHKFYKCVKLYNMNDKYIFNQISIHTHNVRIINFRCEIKTQSQL